MKQVKLYSFFAGCSEANGNTIGIHLSRYGTPSCPSLQVKASNFRPQEMQLSSAQYIGELGSRLIRFTYGLCLTTAREIYINSRS